MAEEIEKRLKSMESGFVIVANDVVGKIEEVHRDVRELGRESRDTFREIRDIRQDMRASFGQVSQELLRIETHTNERLDRIEGKLDQVLALLTKQSEE